MDPSDWLIAVTTLVVGLFGGGGISALYKAWSDRRQGIGQQEVAEGDAIASRWNSIVKAQAESLIAPLRVSVTELEEKVDGLEAALDSSRKKYWAAVAHIRKLYTWISRHMPDDGASQVPEPPAMLAEDI